MKTNCFDLPISMLRMVCGDVTVFYPGVAVWPGLCCQGAGGHRVTSGGAVQGQGPGPCSGYRLCFDTRPVQTAASNLHHHRNHLYAPAVHIPSLDSYVFIIY